MVDFTLNQDTSSFLTYFLEIYLNLHFMLEIWTMSLFTKTWHWKLDYDKNQSENGITQHTFYKFSLH